LYEESVVVHGGSTALYASHACDKINGQLQGPDQNVLELKFGVQVQVIIGAADEDHLSLPVTALRVNSRAGTLVVQFPHTEPDTAPIIWYATRTGSATSTVSCTLMLS
jgi:hypothetical protein